MVIASAKLLPVWLESTLPGGQATFYYSVFFAAIIWAWQRGTAQSAVELLKASAIATAMIPIASLLSAVLPDTGWNHMDATIMIDLVAAVGSLVLWHLAQKTQQRITRAPVDSLWYSHKVAMA